MSEQAVTPTYSVFTIGHSNHDEPTFLGLLQQHRIEVIADVRSQPYSKYTTHFNADQIKPVLGRRRHSLCVPGPGAGRTAGRVRSSTTPKATCCTTGWPRRRCSCRASSGWNAGIRQYRVALMCSEEDPAECHRNLLVSRVLAERGLERLAHSRRRPAAEPGRRGTPGPSRARRGSSFCSPN